MSSILRPNGSSYYHTRMPRVKQTRERKAALDAAYAEAEQVRETGWAEATRAVKGGEINAQQYGAMLDAVHAESRRIIRQAKAAN